MNNKVRSTDYLVEKALGPIGEFIFWALSVLGMIFFYPKLALLWIVLGAFATGCFYWTYFASKKRFLTKIKITEMQYCSYYKKRLCCTVNRNEPIYYSIFRSNEATKNSVPYISFSNQIIPSSKNRLSTYDMNHEIIVQYNQTTWHLFDLEKWICIDGEELEKESGTDSFPP